MLENVTDVNLEKARGSANALYMAEGLVMADNFDAIAAQGQGPVRVNFIMLAMCRKGTAEYTIDTCRQTVKAGDLFFVSERHIMDKFHRSEDFECPCIMLSTQFYHGFVQNVRNVSSLLMFSMKNPVVALLPNEIETYENYCRIIREKIADTSHHSRTSLVKALLLAMFYDMSNVIYRVEQSGSKPQKRADVIFSNFIRLLEENFRHERRVGWYAQQLCITPKYLSETVKGVSKRTPNEWIDSYVILEIRVLLKNSTKNIKELAKELNFPNQSFLGKYFRERVGISPSEYRKM